MGRHKQYIIADVIKEMNEWMKVYDEYPTDYWNYRWDFLKRRLKNISDMEQELKYTRFKNIREDKKLKEKQKKKEESWHRGKL